jgi:hypothetical protein
MLDMRRDGLVRKLLDEGTLPIGTDALRIEAVEG